MVSSSYRLAKNATPWLTSSNKASIAIGFMCIWNNHISQLCLAPTGPFDFSLNNFERPFCIRFNTIVFGSKVPGTGPTARGRPKNRLPNYVIFAEFFNFWRNKSTIPPPGNSCFREITFQIFTDLVGIIDCN